jgi:hypothetical protein
VGNSSGQRGLSSNPDKEVGNTGNENGDIYFERKDLFSHTVILKQP